jgi:hypothetical protein
LCAGSGEAGQDLPCLSASLGPIAARDLAGDDLGETGEKAKGRKGEKAKRGNGYEGKGRAFRGRQCSVLIRRECD